MNEKNTFRAWDPNRKLMYDKVELYADGTIRTAYNSKKVGNHTDLLDLALRTKQDECIIMQCTGMKDKNERLVYEGDILSKTDIHGITRFFSVFFEDASFRSTYYQPWEGDELGRFFEGVSFVIGNIYEDPELAEKTN